MTRTIWLASYPKSGNTWLRILLANLWAKDGKPIDINELPERARFTAMVRAPFDDLLLIDSGLLTHDEADSLRPRLYEELASGAYDDEYDLVEETPPVRFVKVHDAYTLTQNGEALLAGRRAAEGAIMIVRDPRGVVASLANHLHCSIDHAIAFMNDPDASFCSKPGRLYAQFRQQMPTWSGHAASWLDQTDVPIHLVRYEDLRVDTFDVFRHALQFAGWPASEEDIRRAVACADFTELKKQETERGFREAPRAHASSQFFRRGEVESWREELTTEQIARIESAHAAMMQRLGYTLSVPRLAASAQSGEAA